MSLAKDQIKFFDLIGGEDLISPAITKNPGRLLGSQNYEVGTDGGYKRIDGYERFDGMPRPSDASYWILNFTDGDTEIQAGDTVVGDPSGAQGIALYDATVTSGSYVGTDAAGYVILYQVSGTFVDDEDLTVLSSTYAVADGTAVESDASTAALHATYLQAAIEETRDAIGLVTGSGDILGVHIYDGDVYAWRNNAGGTAAVMWVSSSSGWTQVDLGATIAFTAGTAEFLYGEQITGGTSGATGYVGYVEVTSGTWGGSDAAGTIHLYTVTNTFQSETITSASGSATCSGAQTAVTLAASGRYECINYNFQGSTGTIKMYGVDGANKGFMFDGTAFVQITTGMTTDTPEHLAAFKNYLFYSFEGGSLQNSSIADPHTWSPVTGANEIGLGVEITAISVLPGDIMAIVGATKTSLLSYSGGWSLQEHSQNIGGREWSAQNMGDLFFLDSRGITSMQATDVYGDFELASLSKLIEPFITPRLNTATASGLRRSKNQYRLFFSDNSGSYGTRTPSGMEFTRVVFPLCVKCYAEGYISGDERSFFGSTDGYVYEIDAGTSFDGDAIDAFIRLPFFHYDSPRHRKRFRKIVLELDTQSAIDIYFNAAFDYASGEMDDVVTNTFDLLGGGGFWDVSYWEQFTWSAPIIETAEAKIAGSGKNMSIHLYSSGTYDEPHTIQGVSVHYDIRRITR